MGSSVDDLNAEKMILKKKRISYRLIATSAAHSTLNINNTIFLLKIGKLKIEKIDFDKIIYLVNFTFCTAY